MPARSSSGTKKAAGRGAKGSGKRERISPRGDTRYVRRDAQGQFKESDDAGRSQKADRRTQAKTSVKSGYGDRGDRRGK